MLLDEILEDSDSGVGRAGGGDGTKRWVLYGWHAAGAYDGVDVRSKVLELLDKGEVGIVRDADVNGPARRGGYGSGGEAGVAAGGDGEATAEGDETTQRRMSEAAFLSCKQEMLTRLTWRIGGGPQR